MRVLRITHQDLDGIAGVIVDQALGLSFTETWTENYDFELVSETYDKLTTFNKIIVSDLTICQEVTEKLMALGIEVVQYDHHDATAYIAELNGDSVHDKNRCGTKIYYDEYASKQTRRVPLLLDRFVELVNIYDQWNDSSPDWDEAQNLNRVLYKYANFKSADKSPLVMYKDFIKAMIDKINSSETEWKWNAVEHQFIQQALETEYNRYQQAKNMISLREDRRGKTFGVIALPGKISIVCSMLLKGEFEYLDYLVAFNTFGGLHGKVSFRSRGEFDCTQLSPANGHTNAAGGEIETALARQFLETQGMAFTYKDDPEYINFQQPVVFLAQTTSRVV